MLAPRQRALRVSIQRLAKSIAWIRIIVKIFVRLSVSLLGAELRLQPFVTSLSCGSHICYRTAALILQRSNLRTSASRKGSGSSGSTGAKNMKRLSVILLSTAAICAFAIATPAVAQETIMDPEGPAPMTAEPPHTPRHGPGNGHDDGPFAALGAIFSAHAIKGSSADTTQPQVRCQVFRDFNDAHARPTTVCDP